MSIRSDVGKRVKKIKAMRKPLLERTFSSCLVSPLLLSLSLSQTTTIARPEAATCCCCYRCYSSSHAIALRAAHAPRRSCLHSATAPFSVPAASHPLAERGPLELPHGGRMAEDYFRGDRRSSSGRRGRRRSGLDTAETRAPAAPAGRKDPHPLSCRRRHHLRRGRCAGRRPIDCRDVSGRVQVAGRRPAEERGLEKLHAAAAAFGGGGVSGSAAVDAAEATAADGDFGE